MYTDKHKYLVAIHKTIRLTTNRYEKLKAAFADDWAAAWQASSQDLAEAGLDKTSQEKWQHKKSSINPEAEISTLQKCGARAIICDEVDFPVGLTQIAQKPVLLLVKGQIKNSDFPALGVVGSRKLTAYGRRGIEHLLSPLAVPNITIVSGLALGTDVLAHKVALKNNMRTLAVLGNSIDDIYPREHRSVAEEIVHNNQGAIISEYLPGEVMIPENFPVRNRLISGLSRAVLIIEAAIKSGSLITAQLALEQNKEVLALPGEIFSTQSAGTNALIAAGAIPALSAEDIMLALGIKLVATPDNRDGDVPLDEAERSMIKVLSANPKAHIDELIRLTKQPGSQVSATLFTLELKGLVVHLGQQRYTSNI